MCAWQSGGGGSAPFSGASVLNFDVGVTVVSDVLSAPAFTATVYDTDSYLLGDSSFLVPKSGYYGVLFGFLANAIWVGAWEVTASLPGLASTGVSGNGVAGQIADGQVYDETICTVGDAIGFTILQRSGSDQLVFPYARICYLGS